MTTEKVSLQNQGSTADTNDLTIGLALRDLRETNSLSARELADESGVSAAMISRIESGKVSPSISTMTSLTDALEVPLVSLFRDLVSERTDFTHVRKGEGVVSTRMMGDHIHHYVNLATHRGVVFMHVLKGSANFFYGKQKLKLSRGDSLSIDAELAYGVSDVLTSEFVFLTVQAEAMR